MLFVEEYLKLNDELFSEWKERLNHKGQSFIDDGIINPEVWFSLDSTIPKILFVLKEAYGESYSLPDELSKKGPWSGMWNRIAEWSYGLLNYNSATYTAPDYKELSHEEANYYLNRIAVMNLRKSNGSRNSADGVFVEYAKTDNDLLQRQYNLINPDIVIYGYTFDAAKEIHNLMGIKKESPSSHWYYRSENNKLHIDYFHPANRYPALLQYYGLMGIYQKAVKDKVLVL
ncbi:MAG: hypothetical protein IJC12_03275 [Peptococcaceae bacterium]|nr:hypothetical protein [Peptococcaceae bacterium]